MTQRNILALVFRFLFAGMGLRTAAGPRKPAPSPSAAINRWTGKPHLHTRAKARGHTHDRLHTNARWERKYDRP